MSLASQYPVTAFSETQTFLVWNPSTQTLNRVQGSDLVNYIAPGLGRVYGESTRAAALNGNYAIGNFIQTAGGSAIGDGGNGMYLVVEGGTGDYPMMNGNDLLLLPFGSLAWSDLDGALVTDDGAQVAIEDAVENRAVRFASLEDFRASSCSYPEVIVEAANAGTTTGRMILKATGTAGGTPTATGDRFTALAAGEIINAGGFGYALDVSQAVSPHTFGATGGGSDDTTPFALLLTYFKTIGGGIGYVLKDTYRVDYWLWYDVSNVCLISNGAVIEYTSMPDHDPSSFNLCEFLYCRDIKIKGFTFNGRSEDAGFTATEGQYHAVAVYGSSNIYFEQCKAHYALCDNWYVDRWTIARYGISLPSPGTPIDSEHITMVNCSGLYGYRQGLSVISVDHMMVKNSTFSYTGKGSAGFTAPAAGVDLESNVGYPWSPKHVTFENVLISENIGSGLTSTTSSRYVTLKNVSVVNSGSYGISLRGIGNKIINVTVDGFAQYASLTEVRGGLDISSGAVLGVDIPTTVDIDGIRITNGGTYGIGLTTTDSGRLTGRNIWIEDVKNAGIRMLAAGLKSWSECRLDGVYIKNVEDSGVSITGYGYATFTSAAPLTLKNIDIVNDEATGTNVDRGIDIIGATDSDELSNVNIHGTFAGFDLRGIENAKIVGRNKTDDVYDPSLSKSSSTTYDPPNIPAGSRTTTTVTVDGARLGDIVDVTFSLNTQGIRFYGYVTASNSVTVELFNPTAGAIDLASGTLHVKARKP